MSSPTDKDKAAAALRCYAEQVLSAADLHNLAEAQKAMLSAADTLRVEIEKTLDPILSNCSTVDEVLAIKTALRYKLQCSLDGLMEVHFALAYVARKIE